MILSKRSVSLILISVFVLNTVSIALITYIPLYLVNLGVEAALMQLILSIFPLTQLIFPPLLGKYSDRIQNRYLFIIVGTIGGILAIFSLIFIANLPIMIIIFFCFGVFNSSAGINSVLYQELVENDQKFISYFQAMTVLGWFMGAQLFGIFIDIFGIEYLFQFLTYFSLINLFLVIFIKENRNIILERQQSILINNPKEINLDNPKVKSPISGSIYYGLFFRNFGLRPIYSILAIIMAFHLSSNVEIGFLIGVNFLIQFFLMILIGRILTNKNIKSIMIIGYILSAIVIFGYILSTDFIGFLFYQILSSFSYAMFYTAIQVYIAKNTTPKNKGIYLGYANSSFFLGHFLGVLLFSYLLTFNDYYAVMYIFIIFPAISALIILIKFEKKKE